MTLAFFHDFFSRRKWSLRVVVLKVYGRRFLLWFRTNKPFLSGDGFISISYQVVAGPEFWPLLHIFRKSKIKNVTFLPSHLVGIEGFERLINADCKVLILGNSDYDLTDKDVRKLSQLPVKVFAQNLNHRASNLKVLPIGLENRRLGVNGLKRFYRDSFIGSSKKDKILVGPFSMTHPERRELLKLEKEDGPWDLLQGRLRLTDYSKISSQYKYVACPRGNGLDTHRFWETLYRGSIPIVLRNEWSEMISDLGIPILIVNSWDGSCLKEAISMDLKPVSPMDCPALWMTYWEDQFRSDI